MYALRSRGMGTYISWPICGYPNQQIQVPNPGLSGLRKGLGCGCGCGGSCFKGLGFASADTSSSSWYASLFPSGTLFGSGLDVSGWGIPEYVAVGLGVFVLFSVFSTTQRGARRVKRAAGAPKRAYKKVRSGMRAARRRRLEQELAEV